MWPSYSLYIKKVHLSIVLRDISKVEAKILVIPYKTTKLEYYPGILLNASKINYR